MLETFELNFAAFELSNSVPFEISNFRSLTNSNFQAVNLVTVPTAKLSKNHFKLSNCQSRALTF